jgi:hypothetical protein
LLEISCAKKPDIDKVVDIDSTKAVTSFKHPKKRGHCADSDEEEPSSKRRRRRNGRESHENVFQEEKLAVLKSNSDTMAAAARSNERFLDNYSQQMLKQGEVNRKRDEMEMKRMEDEIEQRRHDREQAEYRTAMELIREPDEDLKAEGRRILEDIRKTRAARNTQA